VTPAVHRHDHAAVPVTDEGRAMLAGGAGGAGSQWHSRAHLLYKMDSLESEHCVVVGRPSDNKVSVMGLQV
jgi:hypothetical protein